MRPKNDAVHKAGPVYRQFQEIYIEHKAGLVLCILNLAIHRADEISLEVDAIMLFVPAAIAANKQAKTLLISQYLFHFAEKTFNQLNIECFIYFLSPLLHRQHSVQHNRYIIHNGTKKQVQTYFVQFYLYRSIMHIVHVSGYIS